MTIGKIIITVSTISLVIDIIGAVKFLNESNVEYDKNTEFLDQKASYHKAWCEYQYKILKELNEKDEWHEYEESIYEYYLRLKKTFKNDNNYRSFLRDRDSKQYEFNRLNCGTMGLTSPPN